MGFERGLTLAEDHFDARGEVGKKVQGQVVGKGGRTEEGVCCLGSVEVGGEVTETLIVKLISKVPV